jgi:raffinose/stachyose/melibiose transport system substrate-binding protein
MKAKTSSLFSYTLAILVVCSVILSACQTQTPEAEEPTAEPITIRFTSWRAEDAEMWTRILDKWDELDTGITVEYQPVVPTEYDSVLNTKLQGGTAEEIIFLRAFDGGRILYDAGYVEEITPEMVPNINDFADGFLEAWRTEDGTVYGVPANWVSLGVLYNKDIFEANGFTEPATMDELFGMCKTLNEKGITPVAGGSKDAWTMTTMLSAQFLPITYGGEPGHKKLLAGEILPTDQVFMDHLSLIKRVSEECWPDGFEGLGYGDTQQLFVTEQAAMFFAGSWEIAVFLGLNPDLSMGAFTTPVLESGDTYWHAMTPAGAFGLNANLDPDVRAAAIEFLKWLASPESGQIQGEELAGQFPCQPGTPPVGDELTKEWINFQGDNGKLLTIWWHQQKIGLQEPSAYTVTSEALQSIISGDMNIEEAAKHILDGVATWYEPWQ